MWTLYGVVLLVCGIAAQNRENVCSSLQDGTGIAPVGVQGCRQFIMCNHMNPIVMMCAGGMYFNTTSLMCDATVCVETRNMQSFDCVPGVQPGTSCRDYVVCVNNNPVNGSCNVGTMYSNLYSVCINEDEQIATLQQCNI